MNHLLIAQRVRCILDEIEARRTAGEPWPPSAERIKQIMREVDARMAGAKRPVGIH